MNGPAPKATQPDPGIPASPPGTAGHAAPSGADLAEAVRALRRASVLVVGDAMLDRTVYGRVTRISPEAPVPVLSVEREVAMPGGAGNVVRNLTALGTSVAFLSVVGDDQAGSDLTGLIGGQPGVEPWLLVQGGRATTTKTRFMAAGQQLLRADQEVAQPIHPRLADRLVRIAQDTVAATKVMVLSDYRKGVLSGDVPERLIAAARAAGRRVVVDPKGEDFALYAGADLIVPNRAELHHGTGLPVDSEAEILLAARALRDRHGFAAILVTRSRDGMTLLDGDTVHHFPAEAAEVADISGAGDTVVAVVAAGLAAGLSLPMAARLSNIAAGLVVGKLGTAVARDTDLLEALGGEHAALRKIRPRMHAAEQAERWRRRGWRVGFTEGDFDLLQPSHVHLLEQARGWCDRLIVGVRGDASCRQMNGPASPAQGEAARAAILATLTQVDLVTFFDEDTPLALLEAIRPDVLVTAPAADESELTPQESNVLVQEWGGEVRAAAALPEAEIAGRV